MRFEMELNPIALDVPVDQAKGVAAETVHMAVSCLPLSDITIEIWCKVSDREVRKSFRSIKSMGSVQMA